MGEGELLSEEAIRIATALADDFIIGGTPRKVFIDMVADALDSHARAENARLREALEPFATMAVPEKAELMLVDPADLRRARAALTPPEGA
jgi:hypothetical protein